MIDASKCEFDDCFVREDDEGVVYYFTYPADFSDKRFQKGDYGDVVSMEISMEYYNKEFYLEMSPTVMTDEGLTDVDWKELYENIDYDLNTVVVLLEKVVGALKGGRDNAHLKQSAC